MSEIKCILFDIGGVLVDWHMSWIISEISKRFQLSENLVGEAFSTHLHLLDTGKIDEKIFWEKIANNLDSISLKENTESLWNTYFRQKAKPNRDIIHLAEAISKRSYKMGIISNIEKITHKVVDDWKVLDCFEYKFMSYQIGLSKPDIRIYDYVIKRIPFEPTQIIFIDDKISNVTAAKVSGINAIHFTNFISLKKSLCDYDITI